MICFIAFVVAFFFVPASAGQCKRCSTPDGLFGKGLTMFKTDDSGLCMDQGCFPRLNLGNGYSCGSCDDCTACELSDGWSGGQMYKENEDGLCVDEGCFPYSKQVEGYICGECPGCRSCIMLDGSLGALMFKEDENGQCVDRGCFPLSKRDEGYTCGECLAPIEMDCNTIYYTWSDSGEMDGSFDLCVDLLVEPSDAPIFLSAGERWESKIAKGVRETMFSATNPLETPCAERTIIDDVNICAMYTGMDGIGGIAGYTQHLFLSDDNNLPVASLVKLDIADVPGLKESGLMEDTVSRLFGQALGLGTSWSDLGVVADTYLCEYLGQHANREWQALSGCTSAVPTQGCTRLDPYCLGSEMLSNSIAPSHSISKITVGSLEDLGYVVGNYDQVSEPFSAADIHPDCICTDRRLRAQSDEPRRRLSPEGHRQAEEFGRRVLKGTEAKEAVEGGITYVGNRRLSVVVIEDDSLFFVDVSADE